MSEHSRFCFYGKSKSRINMTNIAYCIVVMWNGWTFFSSFVFNLSPEALKLSDLLFDFQINKPMGLPNCLFEFHHRNENFPSAYQHSRINIQNMGALNTSQPFPLTSTKFIFERILMWNLTKFSRNTSFNWKLREKLEFFNHFKQKDRWNLF